MLRHLRKVWRRICKAWRVPPEVNPTDFSPSLLQAVRRPPSPLPGVMLRALLGLCVILLLWSIFGRLDIVARAEGKLIPQTRLKIVQPFEGGRVSRILVHDGDVVSTGQRLMVMDAQLSEADTRKLKADLETARLQLRRVRCELAGNAFTARDGDDPELYRTVAEQYREHRAAHLHAVAEQRAILKRMEQDLAAAREVRDKLADILPIQRQNEAVFEKLGKKRFASKLAILEKQRARIETEQDLRAQEHTIKSLQAQITQSRERIAAVKADYRQKLRDEQVKLTQQAGQLAEDWKKQKYRNTLLELKAPQDGVVMDLATHTEGTVVPAGTVLMRLVPRDEPLKAEVYVSNQDVGFVAAGQTTKVKLASYQFQKYGMIDGEVERVGADAVSPQGATSRGNGVPTQGLMYKALVVLDSQHLERNGRRFLLKPGMQVTAEIRIGERSVLEYLLSPIQKTLADAGTEL